MPENLCWYFVIAVGVIALLLIVGATSTSKKDAYKRKVHGLMTVLSEEYRKLSARDKLKCASLISQLQELVKYPDSECDVYERNQLRLFLQDEGDPFASLAYQKEVRSLIDQLVAEYQKRENGSRSTIASLISRLKSLSE